MKDTLQNTMQRFYDYEQNISITCFYDGGWDVKIGDEMNGYKASANLNTLDEVEAYLANYYWKNLYKEVTTSQSKEP